MDSAELPGKPSGVSGRGANDRDSRGLTLLVLTQAALAATAACLLVGCGGSGNQVSGLPELAWAAPAAITYGTALSAVQLNATSSVPGSFAYAPSAGTVLTSGSHVLSVTFTPTDSAKYSAATTTVPLTVSKATPVILWNTPASLSYGTPLSEAQLNATSGNVAGTFTYFPAAGTVPTAGIQTLSTTFTPSDSVDYQASSAAVSLAVAKAKPAVNWPAPTPLVYGTALGAMQLDATASGVSGTFSYSPPAGTVPAAGSHQLTATYTPADTIDYDTVSISQTLTVIDEQPPVITAQPRDQSVAPGESATFSVSATGSVPLTYQWLRNSVPIAGATSASYTTPNAKARDNGSTYSVEVFGSMRRSVSKVASLAVVNSAQSSYYVATHGSDRGDGSVTAPFATLQRAQLAMQTSTTKVTQVEAGTYYLSSALVLTDADDGETWEASAGDTVILSGGEALEGWTNEGNGVYSARVDRPVDLDLTLSGVRQIPADSQYNPDEPYTSGWHVLGPNQAQGLNDTFTVLSADLTASVKPGALVQLIDHCRWNDIFTRILSVNRDANSITVAQAFDTGMSGGLAGSWRILDDPADLSAPGQFAYDPASSRVYIKPAAALDSTTVVAARLGTLISLKNTGGITISGFTFSDTTAGSLRPSGQWDESHAVIIAQNLNGSTISGNTFLNVGRGVILRGSSDNAIVGNSFEHVGMSAINLLSNSNRNTIANNSMRDIGQSNLLSYGVALNDSSFNTVDSNLIDGVGRWGIVFGPSGDPNDAAFSNTGNALSHNVIRNTSNRTNDSGAIYGGAPTVSGYLNENLLITGNRIENVGGLIRKSVGEYGAGFAQGIYMDDHLSGVTITNNVIESGSTYGMILCHGCKGNAASNNLVVLQPAPVYDRGVNGSTFSSGDMAYNGTTRIDLLPSYFPDEMSTSTIVAQLSGKSFGATPATFRVEADGAVIGTGTATSSIGDFVFKAALTPRQGHRIGIVLTNGADTGASTTALHDLMLFVNNTAVNLASPEAQGRDGSYGFAAIPDDLMVSNFSVTQNIVYRNGGLSQDVFDMTPENDPSYVDPDPGTINSNILYQNVDVASDSVFGVRALDADSLLADPLFFNPSTGDYRIHAGSPALAAGFTTGAIPLTP